MARPKSAVRAQCKGCGGKFMKRSRFNYYCNGCKNKPVSRRKEVGHTSTIRCKKVS